MGTVVLAGACLAFGIEFLVAYVEEDEMSFGRVPFVIGQLELPGLHFLVIEYVRGVHAFDIVLDLGGIGSRYTNVVLDFLLLVKLASKFRDVGGEVPLDMECSSSLFLLEHGNDAPFGMKMSKDGLDGLGTVANVIVIEFFDVHCVDSFVDNFVKNYGINALLFPDFLSLKVVIGHDLGELCKGSLIGKGFWNNGRYRKSGGCEGRNSGYRLVLSIIYYEHKVTMSSSPACCFDGSSNFGNLLFQNVYGGIQRLTNDFVD